MFLSQGFSRHLAHCLFLLPAMAVIQSPAISNADDSHADDWHYVAPKNQRDYERTELRKLELTTETPAAIHNAASFAGPEQQYGMIRVGTSDSQRIALMIDVRDDQRFDLYVDGNRDSEITRDEFVDGSGRFRKVMVKAFLNAESPREIDRVLVLRRSRNGRTFSVGVGGYVEGRVDLGDANVLARRIDGDGNGLFADSRDKILIDVNDDGQIDPFLEKFPHSPMLRLNDLRLRVLADEAGERMTFEPVSGEGKLKLEVDSLVEDAEIVESEVMVWGADGSAFSIRGIGTAHTLPIGKYTFGAVRLFIKPDDSGNLWSFEFSRSVLSDRQRWHDVLADAETVADPVGELRFELELREGQESVQPGDVISAQPSLLTADGLLINGSRYGARMVDNESNNRAEVNLISADGTTAAQFDSGFS